MPSDKKRNKTYKDILKKLMPHLKTDEELVVFSEVALALKLDGFLDKHVSDTDVDLILKIKESILNNPEKFEEALSVSHKLLEEDD